MPKRATELSALDVRRISTPGMHPVGGVDGLHLDYRNSESRSWVLRVRIAGKRPDLGLGSYPEITLQKARDRAREARELVRRGIDPRLELIKQRQLAKAEALTMITFKEAAEDCWKVKAKEFKNKKHIAQWINTLKEYAFPFIGDLFIPNIERSHIKRVLDPIWELKTETATRVRGRIEAVIDYSFALLDIKGRENPAHWFKMKPLLPSPTKLKRRKRKHHPALPWHLMSAFLIELRKETGIASRCLEWLIQTVARSQEARGATWDEIDMENRLWTIPEHRMKVEGSEDEPRIHRVPLNDEAMRILKSLPRFEGTNLLFPGPRSNAMLSDNTLGKIVDRICAKLEGTPRATPHGFRSSFKDWHRSQPMFEDEVSELALAHVNSDQTRAAYARGGLLPKRTVLMQKWCKFCNTPRKKGNVVQLHNVSAA